MSAHGKRYNEARAKISAIERSCDFEILPTLFRFGSAEPFSIPSASLIRTAAGGVFVMKVNVRSS